MRLIMPFTLSPLRCFRHAAATPLRCCYFSPFSIRLVDVDFSIFDAAMPPPLLLRYFYAPDAALPPPMLFAILPLLF